MAATTLFTFLFDCPSAAQTVELLGSWDNFTRTYHLKRDKRRGHSIWSGCFSFEGIICDGDLDNIGGQRTGPLLMGGTYWYYYKVNDDEEHHDPSEPSTTFCPLLPGQRLNVLEVPMESRSRSNSESGDAFTRNPNDKYLTPVPPKPLPSPRLGDYCVETYKVPTQSLVATRAATSPTLTPPHSRSPRFDRHARSASASRYSPSASAFPDFRGLKDKITSNKRGRSPQRPMRELEIGAPVLISTTAEDVNLVPLSSLQVPQPSPCLPSPISLKLRQFSPLSSNPVDPVKDLGIMIPQDTSSNEQTELRQRRRSQVSSIVVHDSSSNPPGRTRANSSDTRRTRIYAYSNEPWISSPKLRQESKGEAEEPPVLQRPKISLEVPSSSDEARPSSRHGSVRSAISCRTPLDKELPALPRYLVPAPLFACASAAPSPKLPAEEEHEDFVIEEARIVSVEPKRSHFSLWSSDSASTSSNFDDGAVYSPTFSSLTSNSSQPGSPQRHSGQFVDDTKDCAIDDCSSIDELQHEKNDHSPSPKPRESTGPPALRLSVLSFGPDLLQTDIYHSNAKAHRQTAVFGISGFQGYSLPEDVTTSQTTITKGTLLPEPAIVADRSSSVSQLEKLMSEFGYLGDAVV